MITIHRAGDRYETTASGVVTRHCFAAGPFYDPDNLSFGPLTACDEHRLEPGAGFAEHGHRGVLIVSWVLDGALRHTDDRGLTRVVEPGELLVQRCADGIRHREENASAAEPLRFVQQVLVEDADEPGAAVWPVPYRSELGTFAVHRAGPLAHTGAVHAFVGTGAFRVGEDRLEPGDSVRSTDGLLASGSGELLVWEFAARL